MDQIAKFLHNSNMGQAGSATRIKSFNLFGETGEMPDMVHCESIAVRSKLHNWELSTHRHARLHQVLVVEKGGGRAVTEGETHALAPSSLVNVPPGCVHAFSFHEGTQGWVVTLAAEAVDEGMRAGEGLRQVLSKPCVIRSDRPIRTLAAALFEEYAKTSFGRAHILRAMSAQLLGLTARRIKAAGDLLPEAGGSLLQRRFEELVDKHFSRHWSVSDYASQLAVAPGHLSRVLRENTGMPASGIIEARMIREARRLLAFTTLSVAEASYELGFSDPAYFTRVFVRATGLSPRAFRSRLESKTRAADALSDDGAMPERAEKAKQR